MYKNRAYAFIFRTAAFAVTLSGLFVGSGFSKGLSRLLFYTQQSNILIAGLFLFFVLRTGADLMKNGAKGSASYCPRIQAAFTLTISFTFIIFWAFCAPFKTELELITYGNLCVHAFTPFLAIADYFLFCEPGRLKKRDIILSCIIPAAYITSAAILGHFNVVFYIEDGIARTAPYPFMDFKSEAGLSALFAAVSTLSFISLSALLYRIDKKRTVKKPLFPIL